MKIAIAIVARTRNFLTVFVIDGSRNLCLSLGADLSCLVVVVIVAMLLLRSGVRGAVGNFEYCSYLLLVKFWI